MNKTLLIIRREYVTRVRKKSFIIMTLLTPFLFALIFIIPMLVMSNEDKNFKKIAVIEEGSDLFTNVIPDTKDTDFEYLQGVRLNDIKNNFSEMGYYGVLYISPQIVTTPDAIQLISRKQPPIGLLDHISGSLVEGDREAEAAGVQHRKPRRDPTHYKQQRQDTDHQDG